MNNNKLHLYNLKSKKISFDLDEAYKKVSTSKKIMDDFMLRKAVYESEIHVVTELINNLSNPGRHYDISRLDYYMRYLSERQIFLKHCNEVILEKKKIYENDLSIYQQIKIMNDRFLEKCEEIKQEVIATRRRAEEQVLDELFIISDFSREPL